LPYWSAGIEVAVTAEQHDCARLCDDCIRARYRELAAAGDTASQVDLLMVLAGENRVELGAELLGLSRATHERS
jgi:hypothetical protein